MSPGRQRARRLYAARWLLALAIFGATMAIGGVHVTVLVVLTLVLLAATVLTWLGAEPLRARRSASLVLWTSVALTAWTALSVVPLPLRLLAHLSPEAADVWARCLLPLGRPGPAWATLTLDPGATCVQVLRGVAYTLAFVTASRIAARREGVVFLERALIVTGLVLALLAMLHPALGLEKVFGFYTPRNDPGARHIAPILNANVLSEYLNIALALLLGQVFAARSLWPRSLMVALAVVLVGVVVWVASRGGLIGAVLAVLVVAWMSRSSAPERSGRVQPFIVPGLLVLAGVGMGVVASSEQAMGELATTELSKLDLVRETFRIVGRFPVFGVGRGAFESVFPQFRGDSSHIVYTHPEDVVAQWVTEWGVLPAVLALVVLAFALRPASATARSPRAAGAWGAIVAVGVQDLVNFGSEFPAVVLALTVCAAIVTGGTSGLDLAKKLDAWARRPLRLVVVAGFVSVVAVLLVIPGVGHEVYEDRVALRVAALDPNVTRASFDDLAAASMRRHPAEPYLPFAGAIRAVRAGDTSPLPWIERTLDRALVYGPAHLLLARWLARRSPAQARLEYRLAMEQAPELTQFVLPAAAPLVHSYDDATELLPAGPLRAGVVAELATTLATRLPATSRRLDELGDGLAGDEVAKAERRAKEGLADVVAGPEAPWCDGDRRAACIRSAKERANRLIQLTPTRCEGYSIDARLLLEGGDPLAAVRELRAGTGTVSDRVECFRALVDLAERAKADEAVTFALDRITHAGCGDAKECADNLRFVASHEVARGNTRSALAVLERAHDKAPDDDGILEELAALAARVELHAEALRAYERLAQHHPGEARWSAAVLAEKNALAAGISPE